MHTISPMDNEPKYTTSCHMEDQSAKQFTAVGNCHAVPAPSDDSDNNSMTVIKSEDGASDITHSYVLPPFLH